MKDALATEPLRLGNAVGRCMVLTNVDKVAVVAIISRSAFFIRDISPNLCFLHGYKFLQQFSVGLSRLSGSHDDCCCSLCFTAIVDVTFDTVSIKINAIPIIIINVTIVFKTCTLAA